ncbi:unnamed protein product [Cylicocyclus nassatus]|uniref:MADF domain-containing protein n=1 Tax=Cylicocyclus nassatus TaxID=53992 RepID=A0AA36GXD2_CYLNA|nr:unnamed protein product [Cylicocyclus nassatus]
MDFEYMTRKQVIVEPKRNANLVVFDLTDEKTASRGHNAPNDVEKHYLTEQPVLWHDKDPNFKNYAARAAAWRSVNEDMGDVFEFSFHGM